MRIGILGPHRAGKTTLAIKVAELLDLTYIPSPVTAITKAHGFNLATDNRLDMGRDMQQEIFDTVCSGLADVGANSNTCGYIADRTPIDVAAYMMADATAGAGDYEAQLHAVAMMEKALIETERLFDIVLLIPPALQFVAEDGKPPMNPAYQEHHHMLCRAMLLDNDTNVHWEELHRETTNLDLRIEFVKDSIASFQTPVMALANAA